MTIIYKSTNIGSPKYPSWYDERIGTVEDGIIYKSKNIGSPKYPSWYDERIGTVKGATTAVERGAAAMLLGILFTEAETAERGNCPGCHFGNLQYVGREPFDVIPTPIGTNWPPLPRFCDVYRCNNCGYTTREQV